VLKATQHLERAGRYVKQPAGYRIFMPKPLPPAPALSFQGDLQQRLSIADRALGRLDGSVTTLPNPDLFVYMYVRKEAVLSSQIEGTQSSLQDLLSAEALLAEGADSQELLRRLVASGARVTKFEEVEPSLHEIFITKVNETS